MPRNIGEYRFIYKEATMGDNNGTNENATKVSSQVSEKPNTRSTARKKSIQDLSSDTDATSPNPPRGNNKRAKVQHKESSPQSSHHCNCDACSSIFTTLQKITDQLKKLDKPDTIQLAVNTLKEGVEKNTVDVATLKNDVETIYSLVDNTQLQIDDIRSDNVRIELETKSINLILSGVPDQIDEEADVLETKIIDEVKKMNPDHELKYDTVRRLGKYRDGVTRPIRIRFETMRERNAILQMKTLAKHPIYINRDLPEAVRRADFKMRQQIRLLKSTKKTIENVDWKNYQIVTDTVIYRLYNDAFSEHPKEKNNQHDDEDADFLEDANMD